jgi:hypothetical protein
MPYDSRILSFKSNDRVSILALEGRLIIPFVMARTIQSGKRRM